MQIKDQMRLAVETSVVDGFLDIITGASPDAWRGAALDINFILLLDGQVRDLSAIQSITMNVKQATRSGANLISKTLPASSLTAVTIVSWNAGTAQHGTISLTAADMNLPLDGGLSKPFWMLFSAIDIDGNVIVLGGTTLTIVESGIDLALTVTNQGGNVIPIGANYDGGGAYTLGVTAGGIYEWTKGANDTNIVNGVDTLTTTGQFTAAGATVTLHGTAGQPVTAMLRYPIVATLDQVIALMRALLKTANPPGATLTLVSPNGLKARMIGVNDDGSAFNQPLTFP